MGCPTLAIFGPSNPAYSKPYATKGKVVVLWREWGGKRPFSWDEGIRVEEAVAATETLLKREPKQMGLTRNSIDT
ncbi:MAG: hypothetical protein M5U34_22415 [Chloroflexi bacterium]|nr:hypothetical protein [Chloroflexota bacterium]